MITVITVTEASSKFKIPARTIRYHIHKGNLKAKLIGKTWSVMEEDFNSWKKGYKPWKRYG